MLSQLFRTTYRYGMMISNWLQNNFPNSNSKLRFYIVVLQFVNILLNKRICVCVCVCIIVQQKWHYASGDWQLITMNIYCNYKYCINLMQTHWKRLSFDIIVKT